MLETTTFNQYYNFEKSVTGLQKQLRTRHARNLIQGLGNGLGRWSVGAIKWK